jgi:hypothetical protein
MSAFGGKADMNQSANGRTPIDAWWPSLNKCTFDLIEIKDALLPEIKAT